MNAYLLAALVLAAPPDAAERVVSPSENPAASSKTDREESRRAPHELRAAVALVLRKEATTNGAEHEAAVRELVELYREVSASETIAPSSREQLQATIRARLVRVKASIEKRQAREAALAKREGRAPATVALPADFSAVLSQQMNAFGQALGRGAAQDDAGEALLELIKTTIRPDSWDDRGGSGTAKLFGRVGGVLMQQLGPMGNAGAAGAGNFAAFGNNAFGGPAGGGAANDHGEELVELIQAVIAPNSWDVVGGPGTIVYWKNLRVLVVRQTSEVHEQLGGALGQLRKAGN